MKKLIYWMWLVLVPACENQQSPRDLFSTGSYYIFNTDDSTLIRRFANYQIEENLITGNRDSMTIKWLDDSSYVLGLPNPIISIISTDTIEIYDITVNITQVKGDTYVYYGRIQEIDYELTDSVKKNN